VITDPIVQLTDHFAVRSVYRTNCRDRSVRVEGEGAAAVRAIPTVFSTGVRALLAVGFVAGAVTTAQAGPVPAHATVAPAAAVSALGKPVDLPPAPAPAGQVVVVDPAGAPSFTLDTDAIPGRALRAWWLDRSTGTTVDAGSVRKADAVPFYVPLTGEETVRPDWVLLVGDPALNLGRSRPLRVAPAVG
jgi:hypothetical protein